MTTKIHEAEVGWKFANSYAQLNERFYSKVEPTPVPEPKLVMLNQSLAKELGLNVEALQSEESIATFAGNNIPEDAEPIAQAYAGHQFGYFTMLGDGRAILLGEHLAPDGSRVDIQLKGSGRTPYSRGGDGRAALGPMLREYVISEGMHALGIPTTRSLAVVTTGDNVMRETALPGAVLTRVAQSHLRVGTFQYAASFGTVEMLKEIADYAIERHYPTLLAAEDRYLKFLYEVMNKQAELIAKWQLVGFIHGVMNTDNMTISGETIDYGPCAFMDTFHLETVFSSIDTQGRYKYGNQPRIGAWNLARFAESLLPLIHHDEEKAIELAQETLSAYPQLFETHWLNGMCKKLGIFHRTDDDKELIEELLSLMEKHSADYTNTFRALTLEKFEQCSFVDSKDFGLWHEKWQRRLNSQKETKEEAKALMKTANPAIIPRNHRVEEALEAAVKDNDYSLMMKLLQVLQEPYAYNKEQDEYTTPAPRDIPYQTFCGT